MAAFLFTCPVTQMKVQHWLDDDEDASEDDYEGITCEACAGVHFVNRHGKSVGRRRPQQPYLSHGGGKAVCSTADRNLCDSWLALCVRISTRTTLLWRPFRYLQDTSRRVLKDQLDSRA